MTFTLQMSLFLDQKPLNISFFYISDEAGQSKYLNSASVLSEQRTLQTLKPVSFDVLFCMLLLFSSPY